MAGLSTQNTSPPGGCKGKKSSCSSTTNTTTNTTTVQTTTQTVVGDGLALAPGSTFRGTIGLGGLDVAEALKAFRDGLISTQGQLTFKSGIQDLAGGTGSAGFSPSGIPKTFDAKTAIIVAASVAAVLSFLGGK